MRPNEPHEKVDMPEDLADAFRAWLPSPDRALDSQNGYSSLRQLRGSSGCGFGVRSSSMLKKGTTNGSGAITV